jgi:Na+/H+-dicarboxylate symporter
MKPNSSLALGSRLARVVALIAPPAVFVARAILGASAGSGDLWYLVLFLRHVVVTSFVHSFFEHCDTTVSQHLDTLQSRYLLG